MHGALVIKLILAGRWCMASNRTLRAYPFIITLDAVRVSDGNKGHLEEQSQATS